MIYKDGQAFHGISSVQRRNEVVKVARDDYLMMVRPDWSLNGQPYG